MSRTEGFTLPRIPTSHARATSPTSIQPHLAQKMRKERHGRAMTEPSYTSYLGTPRQDVPHHVYKDVAMYEDVFEKRGSFVKKSTHSMSCPLTQDYNSLHDAHCRHLYLNNHKLREHLVNLGLITEDLRIVASTQQQRQKIRAHEMLERKELLLNKLNQKQSQRLSNLEVPLLLPKILSWSISREEERKKRQWQAREAKRKKLQMAWEKEQQEQEEKNHQESARLKRQNEQQKLLNAKKQKDEVAKRLAIGSRVQQFGGKVAQWHRDAEVIKARMKKLEKGAWSKRKRVPTSTATVQSSLGSSTTSITEANREIMDQVNSSLARVRFGKEEIIIRDGTEKVKSEQTSDSQDQGVTKESKDAALEEIERDKTEDMAEDRKAVTETVIIEEEEQDTQIQDTVMSEGDRQQATEAMVDGAQVEVMESTAWVVTENINDGAQEVTAEQDQPAVEVLDTEQSLQLFAALLLEQLSQYDQTGSGYLTAQNFLQVLAGRSLGLHLKNDELYGVLGQLDPNSSGWVIYGNVIYDLAAMLLQLVVQNALENVEPQPAEMQWSQLSSPSYGYLYLNQATGLIQRGRPEEYRPFLKDDIFEDSIVDFFETSDVNQDGMVDSEEFYQLLVSHDVGGRLFPPQVEHLNESFQELLAALPSKQVGLDLQQFATVARMLITIVYRNTFSSAEEWIELDSPKVGRFWLNKDTGETHLPAQHLPPPPDEPTQESLLAKSLTAGTLSSALPTITEGASDEETDNVSTTDHKKHLATGDSIVSGSHDDKKQHRKHKRKSKRKQLEKVAAPPPLRPRSRPTSQQSGTRSEGTSSADVTELGEGLNAIKLNKKQDTEIVKVSTDSKEDTKAGDSINNSTNEHIIHDDEEIIIVEDTKPTGDDKPQTTDDSNNINSKPTNCNEETEATTE